MKPDSRIVHLIQQLAALPQRHDNLETTELILLAHVHAAIESLCRNHIGPLCQYDNNAAATYKATSLSLYNELKTRAKRSRSDDHTAMLLNAMLVMQREMGVSLGYETTNDIEWISRRSDAIIQRYMSNRKSRMPYEMLNLVLENIAPDEGPDGQMATLLDKALCQNDALRSHGDKEETLSEKLRHLSLRLLYTSYQEAPIGATNAWAERRQLEVAAELNNIAQNIAEQAQAIDLLIMREAISSVLGSNHHLLPLNARIAQKPAAMPHDLPTLCLLIAHNADEIGNATFAA